MIDQVDPETVKALASITPQHAAALYDPQTVVKLAREVEVLRIVAENQHPCTCLLPASEEHIDPTVKCHCVCHKRIREALLIWNPDRLPDHPDVIEEPASE